MKKSCLIVALLGLFFSAAQAAPLGPKKPSQLVTLRAKLAIPVGSSSATCPSCPGALPNHLPGPNAVQFDTRVLSDGTEDSPFVIPDGMVLVVTSYDWGAGVYPPLTCDLPSATAVCDFGMSCPDLCPYGTFQQGASIFLDNGTTCSFVSRGIGPADSDSWAGGHVEMPPGVVIKPGVDLCLLVNPADQAVPSNYGSARIHGYLTKDK